MNASPISPRHARRRDGMPKKNSIASVAPPPRKNFSRGLLAELVLDAVVATVSVDVAAVVPVIVIGEVTVHVGGSFGLVIDVVTAQVIFTPPVNPPDGVTVIVAVLPVVAPAVTAMFPLELSAMLGEGAPDVTTMVRVVVAVIFPVAESAAFTVAV